MLKSILVAAIVIVLAALGYHQFVYLPGEREAAEAAQKAIAAQEAQAEAEDAAEMARTATDQSEDPEEAANTASAAADAAMAAASNASAEAQSALENAAESAKATAAAETAAQAADLAQQAAQAATQAATQALAGLSPAEIFTVENYDSERAHDYIEAQDLPDATKLTLQNALGAAEQTPETLEAALASVREALGL